MNIIKTFEAFARFLINIIQIHQAMDDDIILVNPWQDSFLDLVKNRQRSMKAPSTLNTKYAIKKLLNNKSTKNNITIIQNFNIINIINNSIDLKFLKKISSTNSSIPSH